MKYTVFLELKSGCNKLPRWQSMSQSDFGALELWIPFSCNAIYSSTYSTEGLEERRKNYPEGSVNKQKKRVDNYSQLQILVGAKKASKCLQQSKICTTDATQLNGIELLFSRDTIRPEFKTFSLISMSSMRMHLNILHLMEHHL